MFKNYRGIAGSYRAIAGNYRGTARNCRVPFRRMIIGVAGLALGVCVSIFLILQYGHGIDRGHRGSRIYRVNSYEQFLKQEPGKVVPAVLGAVAMAQ